MRIPSFRRAVPSRWSPRSWTRPGPGMLGPRTAAVTFGVLEVLSLRKLLGPERSRGLALVALGGAAMRLLKSRFRQQPWWKLSAKRPWSGRSGLLREPMEAALAMAALGVMALPLVLVHPPARGLAARPEASPSRRHEAEGPPRTEANDGDDGDDLDLNGAIASW
ncbi:hypothetical protein [Pyxidicoccus xibeiensis]|uniref:hypothetical protein n=1 Tax=Pyxidicoccus xibeiensis TaxID=2906759 RepID=UPI0020A762EA|nr:hypothetical protein [Pyxidicoccus xibeiensis]MCP3136041.1 hypothetical protein [Pyxidicoccus xibeiensis]